MHSFFSESAIDDTKERQQGLGTMAGLLGRRKCSWLALYGCLGITTVLMILAVCIDNNVPVIIFIIPIILRLIVLALLAMPRPKEMDQTIRATLPDYTFFGTRLLTLALLAANL